MTELDRRFHETWLGLVQPSAGLVVSIPVLLDKQCAVRQGPEVQHHLAELCTEGDVRRITDLDAFLKKHFPEANREDGSVMYGYNAAQTMVLVLKAAGDNLTRENIMKQAANLKDLVLDTSLPGVKINTSPTDFYPIEQLQMMRFKGEKYELFGPIIGGELER